MGKRIPISWTTQNGDILRPIGGSQGNKAYLEKPDGYYRWLTSDNEALLPEEMSAYQREKAIAISTRRKVLEVTKEYNKVASEYARIKKLYDRALKAYELMKQDPKDYTLTRSILLFKMESLNKDLLEKAIPNELEI